MSKNKSYMAVTKQDTNADGNFDSVETETYVYNRKGELLTRENKYTSTLYDTHRRDLYCYQYDKQGKLVYEAIYNDFDADGTFDVSAHGVGIFGLRGRGGCA